LIDNILQPKNLTKAYVKVKANGGSAGVDGMQVEDLKEYIDANRNRVVREILEHRYYAIDFDVVYGTIGKSLSASERTLFNLESRKAKLTLRVGCVWEDGQSLRAQC